MKTIDGGNNWIQVSNQVFGHIQFTNDLVGQEVYMDKVGLEDLVNFQDVDYEFIMGYYYDEGRNKTIKEKNTQFFRMFWCP